MSVRAGAVCVGCEIGVSGNSFCGFAAYLAKPLYSLRICNKIEPLITEGDRGSQNHLDLIRSSPECIVYHIKSWDCY